MTKCRAGFATDYDATSNCVIQASSTLTSFHVNSYNHGQNIWQNMSFYSPSPNINVVGGKTLFLRKDFIKNSNIDIGGGKSVPKILYKVDVCACDGK